MASDIIKNLRDELYTLFDEELKILIQKQPHDKTLLADIKNKLELKFAFKYLYVIRQYENTIRVSAFYKPLGIMFFMAATKDGSIPYKFKEPVYLGK